MPPSVLLFLAVAILGPVPTFPTPLIGQWTGNLANCGGEDTGGMSVAVRNLSFYEASATLQSLRVARDGTITARLSYTGEGRRWTETNRFRVATDGRSVQVRAQGRAFQLRRCV